MGVTATSGALMLLASCRPAAASLELGPGAGAATTANAILATSVRSDAASRVQLLRTVNRLPKVAFPRLRPDCLSQGEDFGAWTVRFDGYGCVTVTGTGDQGALAMGPKVAAKDWHTHAPLVLGPAYARHLLLHARVETTAQLREGAPNPWEVAWVIWQYEDDTRFYYFIPKPNGWELGKRDPAYPGGQRFLASGTTERFPIGRVHDVTVVQDDDRIAVFVDGREIVRTRDAEKPYRQGRIGIYAEDAVIKVHAVRAL
ncbi:hypothetical protein [Gemmatimonas sp.]|jgi:hypothetical protein|uniref:hypothetical protein n=1 Tax=Gemmatimonas sp. TaxID=1962908 RepID=UPI0022C9663A|nr:hypothetical protein [Gemmatimonas sp.]MCZ8268242.1 hypothetical protein [Gemmatimonas sp.]